LASEITIIMVSLINWAVSSKLSNVKPEWSFIQNGLKVHFITHPVCVFKVSTPFFFYMLEGEACLLVIRARGFSRNPSVTNQVYQFPRAYSDINYLLFSAVHESGYRPSFHDSGWSNQCAWWSCVDSRLSS